MHKGFSLIELLISLIIISVITASLAPVVTRKMKDNRLSLSSKNVTTDCSRFDNENRCLMCTLETCTLCNTQMNTQEGYYVDPNQGCDLKLCEGRFQNCLECNKDFCTKCKTGYFLKENTCETCPNGCTECTSEIKCTACKSGYLISKNVCKKMTDAPCLTIGSICAAKFNAGDANGLNIPNEVTIKNTISSDAVDGGIHAQAICWKGDNTAGCDAANGGYSGCNRTVCTWYAAKKICESHGWRLPTSDEMANWAGYSVGKGSSGLQLCDRDSNHGSARCQHARRCPQADYGNCYQHCVWNSETDGSLNAYDYCLTDAGWPRLKGPHHVSLAVSVRCVRDL